jgi:hypothetical protein
LQRVGLRGALVEFGAFVTFSEVGYGFHGFSIGSTPFRLLDRGQARLDCFKLRICVLI